MKVVMIGSGNVATVFGQKIKMAGHELMQVVGKNTADVYQLASLLQTNYCYQLSEMDISADLYIIAVADKAIASVAEQLPIITNKIIVHTAAAVPANVLQKEGNHYGVIYPLQTLTKTTDPLLPLRLMVIGGEDETSKKLSEFCQTWSPNVTIAGDEERLKLHVMAVFLNNFTNHLFALAQEYCRNKQVEYDLLLPLVEETFRKIKAGDAVEAQTGPARRGDIDTIAKHRQLLQNTPAALRIYDVFTDSIIDFYSKKDAKKE